MTNGALYYPYIHIRDVDWLKGTLLLFDSVNRMLPPEYTCGPNDDYRLSDFQGVGLLRAANLFSERSFAAQEALERRFRASADDPDFLLRYGRAATLSATQDYYGFQIHSDKSTFPLRDTLVALGLAWEPLNVEPYDSDHRYLQMHPRVGQVVMSTIAVASAQHDGLDIVGDERSGSLHRVLLEKDLAEIYDAWLGDLVPAPPSAASETEVFEFLIETHADLAQLTPEALIALDREPLAALLEAIKRETSEIPAMDPGPMREQRFADTTAMIVSEWRSDRQNLSPFWRAFFGGGAKETVEFLKKGADGVTTTIGGAAAGTDVTSGLILGHFEQGLFAAAGTLTIGLATSAIRSHRRSREQAAKSPYRYLTTLEENGVVFRSAEASRQP